jgi:hypothetical protein
MIKRIIYFFIVISTIHIPTGNDSVIQSLKTGLSTVSAGGRASLAVAQESFNLFNQINMALLAAAFRQIDSYIPKSSLVLTEGESWSQTWKNLDIGQINNQQFDPIPLIEFSCAEVAKDMILLFHSAITDARNKESSHKIAQPVQENSRIIQYIVDLQMNDSLDGFTLTLSCNQYEITRQ